MRVLIFAVLLSVTGFAKITEQQQKCIDELRTYKKKGKTEYTTVQAQKTCKKNSDNRFLECISGTNRTLGSLKATVGFCSKKPSEQKMQCVRTMATMKDGKKSITGKKAVTICEKNSSESFLSCLDSMKRPLGSFDDAVHFCKASPKDGAQKCVREVASYKRNKKQALKGKKLANVCLANASEKFLDCLAKNHDLRVCKADSRVPASAK